MVVLKMYVTSAIITSLEVRKIFALSTLLLMDINVLQFLFKEYLIGQRICLFTQISCRYGCFFFLSFLSFRSPPVLVSENVDVK